MKKIISVLFAIFVFTMPATACESNEIDTGSACVESKFEITTSETDVFKFVMSAMGTFYVDCGNGGVLSSSADDVSGKKIIHNNINLVTYTCSWTTSEEQTIRFAGRATRYRVNSYDSTIRFSCAAGEKNQIKTIDGSLGAIFPTLGQQSGQQPQFIETFRGCTNITSLPENLFSGVYGAFKQMFMHTFRNCDSLSNVPGNLFSGVSGGATDMFRGTFRECISLQQIPKGLFSGVTEAADRMFYYTFMQCKNLSGYVHPSTFAGLIANGRPSADYMWDATFYGTKLVKACPEGTLSFGYIGDARLCYESGLQTCVSGTYLPRYYDSCAICPSGSACVGGTYSFNETTDQGMQSCANGTFSPTGSAVCYPHILHVGDSNVYLKSTKQTTPSLNIKIGNDVFYANMTTERTRMSKDSSHYLHVKTADNVHYYVCDDTTCPQ